VAHHLCQELRLELFTAEQVQAYVASAGAQLHPPNWER